MGVNGGFKTFYITYPIRNTAFVAERHPVPLPGRIAEMVFLEFS
jgi:hypothetical protein